MHRRPIIKLRSASHKFDFEGQERKSKLCEASGHLEEAGAEGAGEGAAASVGAARRVLRGKQHEVRVRRHRLPELRDVQLPVVVQQPAQRRRRDADSGVEGRKAVTRSTSRQAKHGPAWTSIGAKAPDVPLSKAEHS